MLRGASRAYFYSECYNTICGKNAAISYTLNFTKHHFESQAGEFPARRVRKFAYPFLRKIEVNCLSGNTIGIRRGILAHASLFRFSWLLNYMELAQARYH